jgi:hypothetical protein
MKKHHIMLGTAAGLFVLAASAVMAPMIVEATPPVTTPTATAVRAPMSDVDAGMAQEDPTTATIVFATSPPVSAMVFWGRKNLGKITGGKPLVVVRPRDSGPLDVIVRANGYLPVQTRAHTFSDQRVVVKLTPPEKKSELLGYKAPLDAGVDMSKEAALEALADAGTPSPMAPPPFQVVPPPASAPAPAGQSPLLSP